MTAKLSKGTLFQLKMGSPYAYATIPGVTNINRTSSKATIDTTDLLSTDKEWLMDFGDKAVSFEMSFDPANAVNQELEDLHDADTLGDFSVTYPDNTQYEFAALVENLGDASAVGAKLTRSVTLKISGSVNRS